MVIETRTIQQREKKSLHIETKMTEHELKVIYWNAYCLPKCLTDKILTSAERAIEILKVIKDYDLVLLNEVWTRAAMREFKRSEHFAYHYLENTCTGKIYKSGLMILSKHPIINPSFELFKHYGGWDHFTSKGVMHFQLRVNGRLFDFFNTHMQQGYTKPEQAARLYQSLQIGKFFNDNATTTDNAWLIGDFNMWDYTKDGRTPYTADRDDYYLRGACYDLMIKITGLKDVQTNVGELFHVLTNSPRDDATAQYVQTNGLGPSGIGLGRLTDGPYIIITIPYNV